MDGEISASELQSLLKSDEQVTIIDIRSPSEFKQAHIPESTNIPFAELTTQIEEFETSDHIVTVCPHGKASIQAARLIASYEGFDGQVESLADGIEGWSYEIHSHQTSVSTDTDSSAPF